MGGGGLVSLVYLHLYVIRVTVCIGSFVGVNPDETTITTQHICNRSINTIDQRKIDVFDSTPLGVLKNTISSLTYSTD